MYVWTGGGDLSGRVVSSEFVAAPARALQLYQSTQLVGTQPGVRPSVSTNDLSTKHILYTIQY